MTEIENTLAQRYTSTLQNIEASAARAGRDINDIRLIAVSKTRSLSEVQALAKLGQRCFGENTLQDAMTKVNGFPCPDDHGHPIYPEWHFIGHLQSKKAGKVASSFHWVHTVDSLKLLEKLSNAAIQHHLRQPLQCLIQVNVSGEESKSGLSTDKLNTFVQDVRSRELPGVELRGLMTIGVQGDDVRTRTCFCRLRELQQAIYSDFTLPGFDQLSMGMSNDYAIAIEEGATMIRVGSAIFGPRQYAT
jgi:pyridoxal phosphate enzyme (YggS family)